MWQVEKVVGRRWNAQPDRIEYLTQWVGCPDPVQNTWEPEENFSLPSLSVFERMWGKRNPPPLDGRAELLTKDEIIKMSLLKHGGQSAIGQKDNKPQKRCGGSKHKGRKKVGEKIVTSESASISAPGKSSLSPSRRSTRLRMPVVQAPHPKDINSRSRRSGRNKGVTPPRSQERRRLDAVMTEEKPAAYAPPIGEDSGIRASVVDWTPINECILLLSALEYPEDLAAVGPGIWMAKKSEWAFEGDAPTTSRQIRHHWEEMVYRECKELAGSSAVNYASHVLNAALASESVAAKTLALAAAGWHRVPGGDPSCSNTMWHRPNMALGTYCKLSENQYWRTLPQSMEQAWEAHIGQIRDGIEEAWIPQGRYADDVIEEVEGNVEEETEGAQAIEEAEEEKEETEEESERKEHEKELQQRAVAAAHGYTEGVERAERAKCKRLMEIRKKALQDGDPRPSLTCRWCGPKQYEESAYTLKIEEQRLRFEDIPAGCKACRYLEELGWRFTFKVHIFSASDRIMRGKNHQGDSKFRTPDGHVINGVKRFLETTTPLVRMEFGKNRSSETTSAPGQTEKPVKTSSMDVGTSNEGCSEEVKDQETEEDMIEIQQPTQYSKREITRPPLPPHSYLLKLERGLVSALAADELHLWNVNYGSNSTVALHTIRSLATG